MSSWVDFKAIKERVTIVQVLERYGVLGVLKEKGDDLIGCCPIHKGTNPTQFHASRTKNNFHCFGNCHAGGNVIDFVVMMEGKNKEKQDDVRDAAMKIQEWFGLEFERPKSGRRNASADETLDQPAKGKETPAVPPTATVATPEKVNVPLTFALKTLNPDHPYLAERGLTKETIDAFGCGFFAGKGIMSGRIAIPIHNEQGELVAYAGRAIGAPQEAEGKYKLPPKFHKSLVVFNLHRAKPLAREKGLIVVEGFFDAMKVEQAGYPNVAALMGSSMSEAQEQLLLDAVGPHGNVALMFDEDDAGRHCREEVMERLISRVYVKVIGLGAEGLQPDKLDEASIRALVGERRLSHVFE